MNTRLVVGTTLQATNVHDRRKRFDFRLLVWRKEDSRASDEDWMYDVIGKEIITGVAANMHGMADESSKLTTVTNRGRVVCHVNFKENEPKYEREMKRKTSNRQCMANASQAMVKCKNRRDHAGNTESSKWKVIVFCVFFWGGRGNQKYRCTSYGKKVEHVGLNFASDICPPS